MRRWSYGTLSMLYYAMLMSWSVCCELYDAWQSNVTCTDVNNKTCMDNIIIRCQS